MADLRLSEPPTLLERWARLSLPLRIGLVYVAARVVTLIFFQIAAVMASALFHGYVSVGNLVLKWDGTWYNLIGLQGYPTDLPMSNGLVEQNAWAFYPLYPVLARIVGVVPEGWGVGAVVVSLAAGYGSCLLLHMLLRRRLDATATMWAVVLFATGPLAALFQVAYAESLGLFLLLGILVLVVQRRWGWLWLAIPLFGATRPGALALAVFFGLYGLWRLSRRRTDPLSLGEGVQIAGLAAWSAVVGLAWTVIAAVATGRPDAYLATELAWRRVWLGPVESHFVPFEGFVQGVWFWAEQWGVNPVVLGVVTVAVIVAFFVALAQVPQVRRLGVVIRLWSASYMIYLLAVFFPQTSIFRLLYPLTPLVGAVAAPRSNAWRTGVLVVGLVLQAAWIIVDYGLGLTFYEVP